MVKEKSTGVQFSPDACGWENIDEGSDDSYDEDVAVNYLWKPRFPPTKVDAIEDSCQDAHRDQCVQNQR